MLSVITSNNYKASFSGSTTLQGTATFDTIGDLILAGSVTGTFGINKSGSGRLSLNGNNTYTGATNVPAGTLLVNGSLPASSTVTVNGTLGGVGTIGGGVNIGTGGILAPGNGPGVLTAAANVLMASGSTFSLDLAHGPGASLAPGIDYDRLVVGTGVGAMSTGAIQLQNAQLLLALGVGIREGDTFFVVVNDGTDPVTGTFLDLPDDTIFTVSGQGFRVSYDADSTTGTVDGGNDIALLAVPEPGSTALLLVGGALLLPRRRRAVTAK
jgi:autotransporter-associated beta strand protein